MLFGLVYRVGLGQIEKQTLLHVRSVVDMANRTLKEANGLVPLTE